MKLRVALNSSCTMMQRAEAFYFACHLEGRILAEFCDTKATLDPDTEEDVIYKLNREITKDQAAYRTMEEDAAAGRTL